MATKSVYLSEPVVDGEQLRVSGDEHHHLAVARAEKGEAVEVFDGRGGVWSTEVLSVSRRETVLRILESHRFEQSGPELILGLSLVKPAAFEFALEKAVEVGVTRIVPLIATRANAAPGRRQGRWKRPRARSHAGQIAAHRRLARAALPSPLPGLSSAFRTLPHGSRHGLLSLAAPAAQDPAAPAA